MQCRELKRLRREDVEEVCGSGEGLSPVGWRHAGLEQQGADNIVSGSNDALSFTVLGGGVGTGHAQVHAMGEEEHAGAGVVELAPVVALDRLYLSTKLSGHMSKEISRSKERVRFQAQGKSPQVMGTIIQNNQVIFKLGNADDLRRPQVTMYKIKVVNNTRSGGMKRKPNMTAN